jgi:hypothetical protein
VAFLGVEKTMEKPVEKAMKQMWKPHEKPWFLWENPSRRGGCSKSMLVCRRVF